MKLTAKELYGFLMHNTYSTFGSYIGVLLSLGSIAGFFYMLGMPDVNPAFLVALLVLVIASLSIIGTVIMLIVEKRDQQLTLRAMGADSRFIRGIFVREGLLISGIGGGIGVVIGVIVVLVQQWFGVIALPSAGFVVESYPVQLEITDLILILIIFVAIAWSVSQIAANTMIKRKI